MLCAYITKILSMIRATPQSFVLMVVVPDNRCTTETEMVSELRLKTPFFKFMINCRSY